MTVTATSTGALAVQGVIDLLAGSTVFQERIRDFHELDAATEANALLYIFGLEAFVPRLESQQHELLELRPFAVVGMADHNWETIAQCSALQYLPSGSIVVALTDAARYTNCFGENPEHDYNDSYIDALNFFCGVIDDWNGVAGGDAAFSPQSINMIEPPFRTDRANRKGEDYWTCLLGIEYGERGST